MGLTLWQRLRERVAGRRPRNVLIDAESLVAVLDLVEEHLYIGMVTADRRYEGQYASSSIERFIGAPTLRGSSSAGCGRR